MNYIPALLSKTVNEQAHREVLINQFNAFPHCSNSVSRTKYHPLTFLPLFLYEQFRNYTNLFFLVVSIVQQLPEASFLGRYTTIVPLSIILIISAIKEIIEDFARYKADKKVNSKKVEVFRDSRWTDRKWGEVMVGDIIKVYENESFAADILLIESSNKDTCICYIDTVNLDGENNLKIRNCVPHLETQSLEKLKGAIECDPPNEFIYEFSGVIKTDTKLKIPISTNNLLLRGASLKNTKWVLGVVIYTGCDTKIMRNASATRLKRSSVALLINKQISVLFFIYLSFISVHWILFFRWNNANYDKFWYLAIQKLEFTDEPAIYAVLVYAIIYSIIIPISLPVMQETSRVIQGLFIANDIELYSSELDQRAVVKTSGLNEDLGLVKYIFADKTGTLTMNVLEFRKCSIDGDVYFIEDLHAIKKGRKKSSPTMLHFFMAIVTGPGVIPVEEKGNITYYTASPDQKALILAAKDFGITLISRTVSEAWVEINGTSSRYEILCEFEFTSERKRSSVIVRSPKKEVILYVLGADDVIFALSVNETYKTLIRRDIDDFSKQGLRSICVAMVIIPEKDFEKWYPHYKKAQEALYNKENLIKKVEVQIVKNLSLLGCTAVEDLLQDQVPETIESLMGAGINVWMLTGDKRETAINIGYSCQLLSHRLKIITLNSTDLKKLQSITTWFKEKLGKDFGKPGLSYALVVTGSSMKVLFDSEEDVTDFILMMLSCKAVICCRTTPKQKAEVVKNVQKLTKYVTLAIGDGANDVAMIQTASIGVGISGMEGMQAANSADYAISQFKHLKKLLLVHGTWSYNRMAKMVFLIYYKNVFVALIQLIYTSQNAWSGQLYFDRWARMLYNVILTSLSTLAMGILEQNLPASVLMERPDVYSYNSWFGFKIFFHCMLNSVVHAAILTVLPLICFWTAVFWSSGRTDTYLVSGNMVYTSVILIVNLKSLLHSQFWPKLTIGMTSISLISWLLMLFALSHTWPLLPFGEEMPRAFEMIFKTPVFYLFIFISVVAVFIYDLILMIYLETFVEPMKSANKLRISSLRQRST